MNTPSIRALCFICGFVVLLVCPWWLSILLLAGLTAYFPLYIEVLLFGFIFDTLYASAFHFPYVGLTVALIFLILVLFIRTRIRT